MVVKPEHMTKSDWVMESSSVQDWKKKCNEEMIAPRFSEGGTEETRERCEMAMIKYSLQGERIFFCKMYVCIYIYKENPNGYVSVNYMLYLHTHCKNLPLSELPDTALESVECTWHFQSTVHVIQKQTSKIAQANHALKMSLSHS